MLEGPAYVHTSQMAVADCPRGVPDEDLFKGTRGHEARKIGEEDSEAEESCGETCLRRQQTAPPGVFSARERDNPTGLGHFMNNALMAVVDN